MRTAFVSQSVVTPEGVRPAAVLVEDGRILEVLSHPPAGSIIHDFDELAILPGLVDSHVHINDPGRSDWEGFTTATRAAAAGGYTTLIDMPLNSIPATTDVTGLRAKRNAAAGNCYTDYAFWGGLIEDNVREVEGLARAGVRGFKCFLVPSGVDEFPMVTPETLRRAAPVIAKTGLPLLAHAELPGPIESAISSLTSMSCDWREYANYLASRPDEAELLAIRLLIEVCRESHCRIHIVHLATATALPELRAARAEGLPITVETCPHYLHFASEGIGKGQTVFKCAPPIRSSANREKLWEGLITADIDLVATDHSPCPPELKLPEDGDFLHAWGGIASLSVALSVIWTETSRRGGGLGDLARWMSTRPAQLAGLHGMKGQIAAGFDADLVVFDPAASFVVRPENLHYRHPLSAYMGETLRGVVGRTYLRGELTSVPRGRECELPSAALP